MYALQRVGCSSMSLKPEQKACIKYVFDGKDVFVWLPTGFGKSVCYEVLPFLFDKKLGRDNSLVVVVSPLVSLMVDQVRTLRSRSVKASVLSSASSMEKEFIATDADLASNSHLFCAPEALVSARWRQAIEKPEVSSRVVAVIVDEADCVSKWYVEQYLLDVQVYFVLLCVHYLPHAKKGTLLLFYICRCHDFHPSYGRIHELQAFVPKGTPFMAYTATVTHNIREVIQKLEMINCEFVSTSPDRPNIYYEVVPRTDIDADLKVIVNSLKDRL